MRTLTPADLHDIAAGSAVLGTGGMTMLGLIGVPTDPQAVFSIGLFQTPLLGLTIRGIVEGDADKLRPHERAVFLTQRNVYQFQAGPGDARPTTAFEGFSFSVRPVVR